MLAICDGSVCDVPEPGSAAADVDVPQPCAANDDVPDALEAMPVGTIRMTEVWTSFRQRPPKRKR